MATAKVPRPSDAEQVGTLLDSPEIAALVSELEATRWTGRPGYSILSVIGMALAKSTYAGPTWAPTVASSPSTRPGAPPSCGHAHDVPSVFACSGLTAKIRDCGHMLDRCIDRLPPADCPARLCADLTMLCELVCGLSHHHAVAARLACEVERLEHHVGVRIDPAREPEHLAMDDLLHRRDELVLSSGLECDTSLADPSLIAHVDQLALRRQQNILKHADQHVRTGEVRSGVSGSAPELLLVELDHRV